jgi:hypothetical protein
MMCLPFAQPNATPAMSSISQVVVHEQADALRGKIVRKKTFGSFDWLTTSAW